MKKTIYFFAAFLTAFVFQINAQTETKYFSGTIGESRVHMTLQRNGGELKGTYYYVKVGKNLNLSGSVDEGNFTLTEKSANGAKTGEFSGKWSKEEGIENESLSGEWKNPPGTKTLDFYLTEEMMFFTSGANLKPKSFSETNKTKLFEMSAEYPEITGVEPSVAAKFNLLAKNKVMSELAKFRKDFLAQTAEDLKFFKDYDRVNSVEISYTIAHADDKIVSISFGNYYDTGGAHPNGYSFALNFDLKTGRELQLADLFKPNSNYLKVISDYSTKSLKETLGEDADDEWIKTGAGAEAKNFRSWNVTKRGLEINFDSYQVAPYVSGPQEVEIPFEDLKGILRSDFLIAK